MRRELGAFESAQALTDEHAPFNVAAVLRLAGPPAPEVLREALGLLQDRHPLLRVRLLTTGGRRVFDSEGVPRMPLRLLDRRGGDDWRPVVEDELNRRFDTGRGPLARCACLLGEDRAEIVLTFHHAVIDATSGFALCGELLALCAALAAGRPPADREPLALLPPAEELFPPAFQGVGRWRRLAAFLLRQMADEARYRWRLRGRLEAPTREPTRCRILPVELSEEETAALVRRTRRARLTLNCVLNAALLLAVRKHLYGGESRLLRGFLFADLRRYLEPPIAAENLGTYFALMRFTAEPTAGKGVLELAREISDWLRVATRRGEKLLSYLMSERLLRMFLRSWKTRMGAVALSYAGAARFEPRYGTIEVLGFHGFVSNLAIGPRYTALARLFRGRLCWDILYLDTDMDEATARRIADEIRGMLKAGIDPERTKEPSS